MRVPNGDHSNMYIDDSPRADCVRALTVQFLDLALNHGDHASFASGALTDYGRLPIRSR